MRISDWSSDVCSSDLAVLRAIGAHRISKIALVPAMIQRLLASPSARVTDYSRLNLIFYGTSPIETDLLREATEVFGCGFAQGYDASETGGGVVAPTPDEPRADEHGRASCRDRVCQYG